MKAPKGKGKKPSGGKQDRGFERARHDAPRSESKFEGRFDGKSDNKGSSFKKPRPQFAKAAPKPVDDKPATPLREIKPYAGARPEKDCRSFSKRNPRPIMRFSTAATG